MSDDVKRRDGRLVAFIFIGFFALIAAVNTVFAYVAISTNRGEVVEKAYEKGLAFNDVLNAAQAQEHIVQTVSYDNGLLTWSAVDAAGNPVEAQAVEGIIIRPIDEGADFKVTLQRASKGVFTARLDLPHKGLWKAKLTGTWNNTQYRKTHQFIAR